MFYYVGTLNGTDIYSLLVSVLAGGLKTETGILYEISTNSFSWGGLKNFSYTPQKTVSACFGGV